jgi:Peptidase family M23
VPIGRAVERLHLVCGGKLRQLPGRAPLGPSGHVDDLSVAPDRNLPRWRAQCINPVEQPGGPNRRVPGEVELLGRREDSDLASLGFVDEHGLAQAEVGGNGLTQLWRDLTAVEEHAQRVAFGAVVCAENAQKMQCRHTSTLRSATSMRPLGPRGLPFVAATMAAVAAGVPAAAAAAEHLAPLAPTLEEASRLATLESLRHPPRPPAMFPVRGRVGFGEQDARFGAWRGGHVHEGQDVFAASGTPLVAVADGEVVEVGSDGGRGNYVSIHDPHEDRTYNYFHMLEPASVKQGEAVRAGQRIGAVGCTGSCFGEHLHFEVHVGADPYGEAEDPLPLLEKLPQASQER